MVILIFSYIGLPILLLKIISQPISLLFKWGPIAARKNVGESNAIQMCSFVCRRKITNGCT